MYDEQYAINILTEQAELNLKYGRIVYEPITTNTDNKITRERKSNNQSETNRTFEKKRHVNKRNEQATTSPNDSEIKFKRHTKLPVRNCQNLPLSTSEEMDREYFYWGAIAEIMETREKPGNKKTSGETTGNSQTGSDEKTLRPKRTKNNLGPVTAE